VIRPYERPNSVELRVEYKKAPKAACVVVHQPNYCVRLTGGCKLEKLQRLSCGICNIQPIAPQGTAFSLDGVLDDFKSLVTDP
jgi:hypothetical protein